MAQMQDVFILTSNTDRNIFDCRVVCYTESCDVERKQHGEGVDE